MTASGDSGRLAWVRQQPCVVCGQVPSEAHHRTGGGMALKNPDSETFPLCTRHHREFHDAAGAFKGWGKRDRSRWQKAQASLCDQHYLHLQDTEVF